jgi:hypothetical protein
MNPTAAPVAAPAPVRSERRVAPLASRGDVDRMLPRVLGVDRVDVAAFSSSI